MVVTLLRQRGEAEAAHPEEPFEEGEEGAREVEDAPESYDDPDVPDPYDDEDVPEPSGPAGPTRKPASRGREAPPGAERRVPRILAGRGRCLGRRGGSDHGP